MVLRWSDNAHYLSQQLGLIVPALTACFVAFLYMCPWYKARCRCTEKRSRTEQPAGKDPNGFDQQRVRCGGMCSIRQAMTERKGKKPTMAIDPRVAGRVRRTIEALFVLFQFFWVYTVLAEVIFMDPHSASDDLSTVRYQGIIVMAWCLHFFGQAWAYGCAPNDISELSTYKSPSHACFQYDWMRWMRFFFGIVSLVGAICELVVICTNGGQLALAPIRQTWIVASAFPTLVEIVLYYATIFNGCADGQDGNGCCSYRCTATTSYVIIQAIAFFAICFELVTLCQLVTKERSPVHDETVAAPDVEALNFEYYALLVNGAHLVVTQLTWMLSIIVDTAGFHCRSPLPDKGASSSSHSSHTRPRPVSTTEMA